MTEDGRLFGGYPLRVSTKELPESERHEYDRYLEVKVYEPDVWPCAAANGDGSSRME